MINKKNYLMNIFYLLSIFLALNITQIFISKEMVTLSSKNIFN